MNTANLQHLKVPRWAFFKIKITIIFSSFPSDAKCKTDILKGKPNHIARAIFVFFYESDLLTKSKLCNSTSAITFLRYAMMGHTADCLKCWYLNTNNLDWNDVGKLTCQIRQRLVPPPPSAIASTLLTGDPAPLFCFLLLSGSNISSVFFICILHREVFNVQSNLYCLFTFYCPK